MNPRKRATELDWETIPNFSQREWPSTALYNMQADLIQTLADVRRVLPTNYTMTPSPLLRAHVREYGGSRHSTNGGLRLSDATDIFMQWDTIWGAWQEMLQDPRIGGIGLYVDSYMGNPSKTRPMFHIDLRPERVMWVCWKVRPHSDPTYTFHHRDPLTFHRILAERGLERDR